MARDEDIIEMLDEQLKKFDKVSNMDENKKYATGRRCERGRHEAAGTKTLEKTGEFKTAEDTDTKIFDAEVVQDAAIVSGETTKINDVIEEINEKEKLEILEETIKDKVELEMDEVEDTREEDSEMSDTFVDGKPLKKNKKKLKKEIKIIIILVIAVILIIFMIIAFFVLTGSNDKDNEKIVTEKELTEKQKKKLINKYGEALEKVIKEELEISNTLLEYDVAAELVKTEEKIKCHEHEIYNDGSLYLNKCSINGIMTKYSYGELQEILSNALKVYVEKSSGKATLSKPSASKEPLYNVYEVDCGDSYSGVYLLDDYVVYYDISGLVQMKNFMNNTKALSNLNYKEIVPIKLSDKVYDTNYVAVLVDDFWGVYKLSGEQIISPMYSYLVADISKSVTKRNSIKVISGSLIGVSDGNKYGVIDYTSNKTVIPLEFDELTLNGKYILGTVEDGNGRVFDFNGKEYFAGSNIHGSVNGEYFLIEENNKIKLSLINGKKLYDYGIINNIGKFYSSKATSDKITFQFLDTKTNGRCIEFVYSISDNSGEYTSDKLCGIN